MGMYTELVMAVELKPVTPIEVINTLRFMVEASHGEAPPSLPNHPLFGDTRWRHMLQCDSYYFDGDTSSTVRHDEISEAWHLTIRCNLKNYDNEIEKFCDWLEPWFETEGFYGYKRYEEDDDPTLLYTIKGRPPGTA